MKELFVSYEIAKLAKEKGFDEPCIAAFIPRLGGINSLSGCGALNFEVDGLYTNSESEDNIISAPIHQQLIDWLYSKGIVIFWDVDIMDIYKSNFKWYGHIGPANYSVYNMFPNERWIHLEDGYSTPNEARDAAIEEALNLLP